MDKKAFRQFTYGLFLITAVDAQGRRMGCVVNTAEQVASNPYRILFTLNKDNATCKAVAETGRVAVTILNQKADMGLIGTFGFKTSTEVDKFAGFDVRQVDGLPFVADAAASTMACTVDAAVEAGTHMVFVCEVTDATVLDADTALLTYDYYHRVLKGTTPPKASSFEAPDAAPVPAAADAPALHHFRCLLCGYVVETPDAQLPADFTCPMCGAGTSMFKQVD